MVFWWYFLAHFSFHDNNCINIIFFVNLFFPNLCKLVMWSCYRMQKTLVKYPHRMLRHSIECPIMFLYSFGKYLLCSTNILVIERVMSRIHCSFSLTKNKIADNLQYSSLVAQLQVVFLFLILVLFIFFFASVASTTFIKSLFPSKNLHFLVIGVFTTLEWFYLDVYLLCFLPFYGVCFLHDQCCIMFLHCVYFFIF